MPLPPGRKIRVVYDLTPEEYAILERGEDRVRRLYGKRLSRSQILMKWAKSELSQASPEARVKLPIILSVDGENGTAWYETRRGPLPADRQAVEQAVEEGADIVLKGREADLGTRPRKKRRPKIPARLMRALMARCHGRCEMPGCGRGAPLHVHHVEPVSRTGMVRTKLALLKAYCDSCHLNVAHRDDFATGTDWDRARKSKRRKKPPDG